MRWIIAAFLVRFVCLAADPGASPGSNSPPSAADEQSQLLFLTAKVKSLAEVQALVLKQQQLILEHLDAIHQQVSKLELERTNLVPRAEWASAWRELDHWREQVDAARSTNGATAGPPPSPTALKTNQNPAAPSTLPENAEDPNAALAALLRRLSTTNPTPSQNVSPEKAPPATNSPSTEPPSHSEAVPKTIQTPVAVGGRKESNTGTNASPASAVRTSVISPSNALPVPATSTNMPPTRYETYRVQPGDTLSKIIARWNEALDTKGLPHLTQEEVEKANPSLNPDLIRVGQKILIPAR